MSRRPVTTFEQKILAVVLAELRRACRLRRQLTVIIDPFVAGGGAHIFASPNEAGRTYEIEGDIGLAAGHRSSAEVGKRYGSSSKLPRGMCPRCGNEVALRKGDLVREHRVAPTDARPCRGSGKPAVSR